MKKYEFILQQRYIFSIIHILLGLDQVLGFFLNKSICFIFLLVFLLSCFQKQDKELAQEIRNLEFQRSADSSVFEKYSEHQSVEIRILTADAIAKIGNPVHLPVLQRLLLNKDPRVIKKSIFALGQIDNQDSLLLAFLTNDKLVPYQKNIIQALGTSKSDVILNYLLNNIDSFPDSLKPSILETITFIAPKNYKNQKIRNYLLHDDRELSGAAAYFYSRHPLRSAVAYLIQANIQPSTLWDQFRLKALGGSLREYNIQYLDSTLYDSLRYRLLNDLTEFPGPWQNHLYELSILGHYQDSLSFKVISKCLTKKNPHLRLAAINAIAQFDTIDAKPILLQVYQEADWNIKGHIILALAKKDPEMIYSLIQQNLDKGHTYFKQLLLKSLARLNNRMSIRQLRQFLLVPDIRLNLTAYDELSRLGYIGYKQTKEFLLSGEMALATVAAQWIVAHPEFAKFDDLSAAYAKFSEPRDVETLLALLQAMIFVASEESNQFFQEVYKSTKSTMIARETREILSNANIDIAARPDPQTELFIPEKIIIQKEPIFVTIETSKGNIVLELFPEIAPATVSNFLHLAQKGYYNNLLFHRVVPDFVVQCGDPRGDGWGGPGYAIPCEYSELPFERGTIGMATSGKDTGGSQFFICHSKQPHLDRRYTVFGKVRDGMENVDLLDIEDKIIQIVIQN
jgi:cyclophilin family peptidyl-prolyl cis-trans isomerase/HEAT repeat protein